MRKPLRPFRKKIRRVRHRLHAARNNDFCVAGRDGLGCKRDRLQARPAHHVQRHRRHRIRETTAQTRLARGVLAQPRSQHTSHQALVDARRIDRGASHCLAHHMRSKLCRRERSERALEFSNRRARRGNDDGVLRFIVHGSFLLSTLTVQLCVTYMSYTSVVRKISEHRGRSSIKFMVAGRSRVSSVAKKNSPKCSIFLDTEFHQIYTFVSCS